MAGGGRAVILHFPGFKDATRRVEVRRVVRLNSNDAKRRACTRTPSARALDLSHLFPSNRSNREHLAYLETVDRLERAAASILADQDMETFDSDELVKGIALPVASWFVLCLLALVPRVGPMLCVFGLLSVRHAPHALQCITSILCNL